MYNLSKPLTDKLRTREIIIGIFVDLVSLCAEFKARSQKYDV